MLDDLQGLTLANAVEAFNRITKTARQFFLQLHADSAFRALGLQPVLGSGYTSPRMLRNGRADSITQADDAFTASVFLSIYMHPTLPDGHRIFIAFDLLAQDQSEVHLLAGRCERASTTDIAVRKLAAALRHEAAASGAPSELPYETTVGTSRWTYDRRLWQPGAAREDIKWTVTRAEAALLGLKA